MFHYIWTILLFKGAQQYRPTFQAFTSQDIPLSTRLHKYCRNSGVLSKLNVDFRRWQFLVMYSSRISVICCNEFFSPCELTGSAARDNPAQMIANTVNLPS